MDRRISFERSPTEAAKNRHAIKTGRVHFNLGPLAQARENVAIAGVVTVLPKFPIAPKQHTRSHFFPEDGAASFGAEDKTGNKWQYSRIVSLFLEERQTSAKRFQRASPQGAGTVSFSRKSKSLSVKADKSRT
jgi:hypothetical protein